MNVSSARQRHILELHAVGYTDRDISQQTGVSLSAVQKIVRDEFGKTHPGQSRSAVNAAERRQLLVNRLERRAHRVLDRLEAADAIGFQTVLKGSYGVEEEVLVDSVPTRDEQALANSLGRYMSAVRDAEAKDSTVEQVSGLLTQLADALGVGNAEPETD